MLNPESGKAGQVHGEITFGTQSSVEQKTRLKPSKELAMSSRSSRRVRGSVDLQQVPPRKRPGYWHRDWLTPPRYSVNCASLSSIQVSAVAQAGSSLAKDPGADSEPIRKKRRYAMPELGMEEEQVTRDLCTSFQSVEFKKLDVLRWRSSSNSLNGMDLQQSGTTSEEDLIRDGNDNDSADTVRSAAELLTQLTCGRSSDSHDQFPDVTSCGEDAGQDLERPIRWGVKKKVSYESRRSLDSCDLGLCTGLISKFSYGQEKGAATMPAHTPDQKIGSDSGRQDFQSPVMKWDHSSPNYPACSKYHRDRRSSGDGGTSIRPDQLSGVNFEGPREKHNKIPSTSRTCPGNMLKLPKEMQGRWSSERYKTAQLKLIDIMHARKAVPGKPILRPALREEARKHIGDTGLLDHLLKHMTDTVVSTGERFRRRHNSEGAMEYWLEHASLMELRKAAGVEDPSWIPPEGWKAGDKLPDRNWQLYSGMTSSEAAEMENLKETVERLKSDMGVLCGSIKVSNQRGVLTSLSVSHHKVSEDVPAKADEEEDLTEEIRKDMIEFRTDTTSTELQQYHREHNSGAKLGISLERFQNLDSAVLQRHKMTTDRLLLNSVELCQQNRKPLKEISLTSGSQLDLESQLQDVRKAVTVMQAEVSDIINILGIVQPVKATPVRYQLDPSTSGIPNPLMLSASGQTCSITCRMSSESQRPGTSEPELLHDLVIPNFDAPMRQCSNVKNATRSSNVVDLSVPYTDGLSQALSNYKLVNQPDQLSAHDETKKPMENSSSTMNALDCVPPNIIHSRPQNFKSMFTNQPTGFRLCRPPGSFVWPSMMNITTKNPPSSRQEQLVDFCGLEAGSGNTSVSSAMGSTNYSIRSIAESQVAATMATMFGCMAMAPQYNSVPTLPLMTSEIDMSVRDTRGTSTATTNLGQCSSGQSNSALSLSLSLSMAPGIPTPSLKKQKST